VLTVSAVAPPKNWGFSASAPFLIAASEFTPSWVKSAFSTSIKPLKIYHIFTQLGVNNWDAIINGGIAGKSQFFGGSTSEIVSVVAWNGSWDNGRPNSVALGYSWQLMGGATNEGSAAGVLSFYSANGGPGTAAYYSHRTILSGY
jgi:hypothetical protein